MYVPRSEAGRGCERRRLESQTVDRRWGRSVGIVCVGVLLAVGVSACSTTSVGIVNDTSRPVRLSGCFIDDSWDLRQSQATHDDMPSGRWGCSVYTHPPASTGAIRYVGCLVIGGGDRTYLLSADVRTGISDKKCEHRDCPGLS